MERSNGRRVNGYTVNKRPIVFKWVFKVKLKPDGLVAKHKAMLVAKCLLQKVGFDYLEVFAPVVRFETVRMIVALTRLKNWQLW